MLKLNRVGEEFGGESKPRKGLGGGVDAEAAKGRLRSNIEALLPFPAVFVQTACRHSNSGSLGSKLAANGSQRFPILSGLLVAQRKMFADRPVGLYIDPHASQFAHHPR